MSKAERSNPRDKVSLVIPPSPFLADERVFPSLGILKVASVLEESGRSVDVVDLSGINNFPEVMEAYLEGQGKGVENFGITATSPQFPQAVKIAEKIREKAPDAKIIFGGSHATMVGTAKANDDARGIEGRGSKAFKQMIDTFDTSVVGDGEKAVFHALETDEKVVDAGTRQSVFFMQRGTLEQYPMPARHLIDMDSYHYQIDGREAQSMIAQLGCPFGCGFCGGRHSQVFRIARMRSVESVMEEVDILAGKYNKDGIMFYDDELNISNNHLMELCQGLIEYQEKTGREMRFRGFVKAELFTQEQAKMMYRAGFRILLSGVESGDNGILETMEKGTTRETNARWVRFCHEAGLQAKALMSIGHPGESRETINNSLEWVLSNKPDDVDWTIITQYPGSPYFDLSVPHQTQPGVWVFTHPRNGKVLYSKEVNYGEEASYYKGVPGDYTSFVWTDHLDPQELVLMRDWAESVSRQELKLPAIRSIVARQFEKSMGQRDLPDSILRSSK